MNTRFLIVNADDFGLSRGVNEGIIQAHTHGIVTSATLMVRQNGAEDAATQSRAHPNLSVGLHLDLGEWIYRDDEWQVLYQHADASDGVAVAAEIIAQLQLFRDLMGREPTHLDSHQHVHQSEPVRAQMEVLASALQISLRHFSFAKHCGAFYGQSGKGEPYPKGISVENLQSVLRALPEGVSEMGCHAGSGDDFDSVYKAERAIEVQTLCDPRIREELERENIELRSFHDFAKQ